MGGLRLRRLAAAANVSYLAADIRVFLIKGRLRYRSRCGKTSRAGPQDVALLNQVSHETIYRSLFMMLVSLTGTSNPANGPCCASPSDA